jgi:actin-related protein
LSRAETLHSLESLLEQFLQRAVALKEERLHVLDGINRLDDIARGANAGSDLTEEVGGWFAQHSTWLQSQTLRPADQHRIRDLLDSIKHELERSPDVSPAQVKIHREIDRWATGEKPAEPVVREKIVLTRGPEGERKSDDDTIAMYDNELTRMQAIFRDMSANKTHIMTILDDALLSAKHQQSRDALLLSASIIYYLKLNRYKVDPYVKRLKEAEKLLAGGNDA